MAYEMAFGLSVPASVPLERRDNDRHWPIKLIYSQGYRVYSYGAHASASLWAAYLPIMTSPDYPCRFEIYLKEDAQGPRRFGLYRTVGYIPGTEFYHPVYDTPERLANKTPDRRTTLYWEPYLRIGDDGKGSIEFYTNDKNKSRLEIVIEGIAADGSVCRTLQRLE